MKGRMNEMIRVKVMFCCKARKILGGKRGVLFGFTFLANKLVSQVTFFQEKGLLRATSTVRRVWSEKYESRPIMVAQRKFQGN
jgi:hypothetical protein